jgi:hypothetical protein
MNAIEAKEEFRWGYMNEEELERRLDRITNPKKLAAFISCAKKYKSYRLAKLAEEKLNFFKANEVV